MITCNCHLLAQKDDGAQQDDDDMVCQPQCHDSIQSLTIHHRTGLKDRPKVAAEEVGTVECTPKTPRLEMSPSLSATRGCMPVS